MHSNQHFNRLLIIDNDRCKADFLANVATRCGYSAMVATRTDEAQSAYLDMDPTVVILNLEMQDSGAIQVLRMLGELNAGARVIIVSGNECRSLRTAIELGNVVGLEMSKPLPSPVPIYLFTQSLLQHKIGDESFSADHLRHAIANGQIRPYYQPIASCQSPGKWVVDRIEALARWHIAETEILLPDAFLKPIEENGLSADLTECMLRQVVTQIRSWREKKLLFTASVNINASLLADRDLPERLDALTSEAGIENNHLVLETPEMEVLEYSAETIDVLGRLSAKGFGLTLDNFGAGYSSLPQLHRMPFTELKIDRSITGRCHGNEEARTIVDTTLAMAHQLGLSVCAVGVESRQVFDFLETAGCTRQQGYLIGKPGPADTLPKARKKLRGGSLSAMRTSGQSSTDQRPAV